MGRKAEIDVYGYEYRVSVDGAGRAEDRVEPDDLETSGWFPHFPFYYEDAQGRLLYFYQPMTASLANVRHDVNWLRDHPRPHFSEVFDQVDLREEWPPGTCHVVKTLHSVTLLEAMDGLVEMLRARDGRGVRGQE